MNMAQMLVGWPAVIVSLLLAFAGIIRQRALFVCLAMILMGGFVWYLLNLPGAVNLMVGSAVPVLYMLLAFSVAGKKFLLAWLLLGLQVLNILLFIVYIS
ncbi:MAG: hypothetical protein ACOY81_03805 [Bacillota bacterium]|uniref:hypothetical protein n=1 Tax=Desulfurispora thermophila TaxID=265470 RepID=UPI00035C60F4|nr:hypothetical protein [Desulfurispora thermophila]